MSIPKALRTFILLLACYFAVRMMLIVGTGFTILVLVSLFVGWVAKRV